MPKKGGWTLEEDLVLVEYVKKEGEGRWNMVERSTGLVRCGKSCRLRWFNHLRPNLRRGAFSPDEERLVIQLHAKIGPRWSQMAKKLPGRSDNEIKNFWNTRAKRLERARLPLYPRGIVPQYNTTRQHNRNHTTVPSSSYGAHFANPSERTLPTLLPSYPNSTFQLSPHLSMGPFGCSRPLMNLTPDISNLDFPHYNSYPRNENGSNFEGGSSSNTQPFPLNIQTPICLQYPFQLQFSNMNANLNPPLSMPTSLEPQSVFANNGSDPIESLLGLTSESNSTNMSSLFDLCGSNFNIGSSFNTQSLLSYTQTPIPFQYPFLQEWSNLNTNPNPLLCMPDSFEPQSVFANNEGPDQIGSLLGLTPASSESINGSNSMNVLFDLQNCFTLPYKDYNSYPGNGNVSNSEFGSSSNTQTFSSNTQTPISFQYPYQSQSINLNTNLNPPLSMPTSFEPQSFIANNKGPDTIESLLGSVPASLESINGTDSMIMSSLFDIENCFTPPYTNDGLPEDFLRDTETLVPGGISSGKGKAICTWPDSDCGSSSSYTITGMQTFCSNEEILPFGDDPNEEMLPFSDDPKANMLPFDDDLSALLDSFPVEVPSTDWY